MISRGDRLGTKIVISRKHINEVLLSVTGTQLPQQGSDCSLQALMIAWALMDPYVPLWALLECILWVA